MKPNIVTDNTGNSGQEALSPASLNDFLMRLESMLPNLTINTSANSQFANNGRMQLKDGEVEGDVEIQFATLEKALDSSSITPNDWQTIATIIQQQYSHFDAFIILHGTDTIAYSASALSFIFRQLSKPIILTGSQLPLHAEQTDAIDNFLAAIKIASYKILAISVIAEVVIVFGGKILRGNRASKVHTSALVGFSSPSFPVLGTVNQSLDDITINEYLLLPATNINDLLQVNANFDANVNVISLFPGISDDIIYAQLVESNSKAIVIASYGVGNMPNSDVLYDALTIASTQGKLLLNVSQCMSGKVDMSAYAVSAKLIEIGLINGSDLTIEAAITKLMWLLGSVPKNQYREIMSQSIRGEQSV